MGRTLDWLSRLVTVRPWVTLAVIAVVTLVFVAGYGLRAPVAEYEAFLPTDSDVAQAMAEVETLFADSADLKVVTIVFRGDVLTPGGLAQMDALLNRIAAEPGVSELLPAIDAVFAPGLLLKPLLQVADFNTVTQDQIDSALGSISAVAELQALLELTTGTDSDGTSIGVATVRLRDTGDDLVDTAALAIDDLATAVEGPLTVSTVSIAVIEKEFQEATGERVTPLLGLALLVIAVLTFLFMRNGFRLGSNAGRDLAVAYMGRRGGGVAWAASPWVDRPSQCTHGDGAAYHDQPYR